MQTPVDRADPSVIVRDAGHLDRGDRTAVRRTSVEPEAQAPSGVEQAVLVGAVRVDGAQILTQANFAPAISPWLGRELGPRELSVLASDIAGVARRRGYGLATAWVPPQRVSNGILHVAIEEGRIDAVHASGAGASAVERRLVLLVSGKPVTTAQLERQLLLAGDIAGVRLGKARLQRSDGRNILFVTSERDRIHTYVSVDNWGSSTVGPERARLALDINGVLGADDRLSVGGMFTPLQPREFAFASLAYSKPIGARGTEIVADGYYARSHPGRALGQRDIRGRSAFVEVAVSHALARSRSASAWGYLQFGLLDASESERGEKFRDDRIATLGTSIYATAAVAKGRLRGKLGFRQGLDLLGASGRNDPLLSRPDGSAVFSKLEFWTAYDCSLDRNFSFGLQALGQIASRPLLSSEEMGLGGRAFLRGYDYREFSGDKGIAGSAELRFDLEDLPRPLRRAQIYLFADAGSVGNYRGGHGSGSLASAGGGLRLSIGTRTDAGLEVGVPLSHGALPGETYAPRLSFTLNTNF